MNAVIVTFTTAALTVLFVANSAPAGNPSCPADLDGSQGVSVGDLNQLLSSWATDAGGDIDGDRDTDIDDLNILLADWGTPCPLTRGDFFKGRLYPLCTEPGREPLSGPAWPGVGDLNGDGIDDIVAKGGEYCTGMQVLFGSGDRQPVPSQSQPLPAEFRQAIIVDLNSDSALDVLVLISTDGVGNARLATFINDGTGQLTSGGVYDPWARDYIATSDFNGDGLIDVASVRGDDSLRIIYGDGRGGFVSPENIALSGSREYLAAGDLNNDGSPDIVAAAESSFSLMLNLKSGWQETAVTATAPLTPNRSQISLGDINADGFSDILYAATESRVGLLLSDNGGGYTSSAASTGNASTPRFALATDIDNDGDTDALAGTGTTSFRLIPLLNMEGTLELFSASTGGGTSGDGLAHGDFDGDGTKDLIAVSDDIRFLFGDGTGNFSQPVQINSTSMYAIQFADLDGDGELDFVSAGTPGVHINLRTAPGVYQLAQSFSSPNASPDLALEDFDDDGDIDIAAVRGLSTLAIHTLLLNNGDGTFTESFLFGQGEVAQGIELADLNKDGHEDIVIVNYLSNDLGMYLSNGDGTFTYSASLPVGTNPVDATITDLNRDGIDDIAIALEGDDAVAIHFGNGAGGFSTPGTVYPHTCGLITSVVTHDVNGDSWPDLLTPCSIAGAFTVRMNQGDGSFGPITMYGDDVAELLVVDDLNLDGSLDVITLGGASATIYLNTSSGAFETYPTRYAIGLFSNAAQHAAKLIDIDGDGIRDLVTVNRLGTGITYTQGVSQP